MQFLGLLLPCWLHTDRMMKTRAAVLHFKVETACWQTNEGSGIQYPGSPTYVDLPRTFPVLALKSYNQEAPQSRTVVHPTLVELLQRL